MVLAIGNPLGLSGSMTEGMISATDRVVTEPAAPGAATQGAATQGAATLPGAIQTSAPINRGNRGGALVSLLGQVIGIPTLAAASPQGGAPAQGIGFAIPSNLARDIATQIIESGHVTNSHRAALGAEVATVLGADGAPGQGAGVGVVAVTSGGAADRAGLRPGDVIKSAGPEQTPDTSTLSQALAAARPGDKLTLTITRDSRDQTVQVTLGELPVRKLNARTRTCRGAPAPHPRLGAANVVMVEDQQRLLVAEPGSQLVDQRTQRRLD